MSRSHIVKDLVPYGTFESLTQQADQRFQQLWLPIEFPENFAFVPAWGVKTLFWYLNWMQEHLPLKTIFGVSYVCTKSANFTNFIIGCLVLYLFSTNSWPAFVLCILFLGLWNTVMLDINAHSLKTMMRAELDKWTEVYSERVLEYLGKAFDNPRRLLQGMANANLTLIGPRALPYFFNGDVQVNQPWDFATHESAFCVGRALAVLEECGVVWDDIFDIFRDMERPTGKHFEMQYPHFVRLRERARRQHSAEDVRPLVDTIWHNIGPFTNTKQDIQATAHANIAITMHTDVIADRSVKVVYGSIQKHGEKQMVRLIFGKELSPIDIVMRFQYSTFQCWISAYGAAHLYFWKTWFSSRWMWPRNLPVVHYFEPVVEPWSRWAWWCKYDVPKENSEQVKHLNCWGPKLTLFNFDHGQPKHIRDMRVRELIRMRWEELDQQTVLLRAREPPVEMEHASVRLQMALGDADYPQEMKDARWEACRRTVYFDRCGDYKMPDELPGI